MDCLLRVALVSSLGRGRQDTHILNDIMPVLRPLVQNLPFFLVLFLFDSGCTAVFFHVLCFLLCFVVSHVRALVYHPCMCGIIKVSVAFK